MFRNYLIAVLRNLARNKLYASINIFGLAIGFAVAILIALFVRDELNFDRFIPDADNIYNVYTVFDEPSRKPLVVDTTPGDLAAALRLDFPSIHAIGQLMPSGAVLRHGNVESGESLYWADANIFSILQLPIVTGNLTTALQKPDGIVLTRRMARKYFGRDDPIGQTIEITGQGYTRRPMTVTAILEDLPSNTNLNAEIFASGVGADSELAQADTPQPGFGCNVHILIRVPPGSSIEKLRRALPAFLLRHKKLDPSDGNIRLELRSLIALHLMPSELSAFKPSSNRASIYSLAIVGVLIVLVASINFVNLMTARAAKRSVEVGIRKASGATRSDLIQQFIGESLLYAAFSMLLALALVELLLPAFAAFLGRNIVFQYWANAGVLVALMSLVLFVGALAGAYPAFVLSAFSAATIFRSAKQSFASGSSVRQLLVVIQFAILIALLIVTGVIYRQTNYAMNEALRFDKDQVLMILTPRAGDSASNTNAYADGLRRLPGISAVAQSSGLAMSFGQTQAPVIRPDGTSVSIYRSAVDFGFLELYGLKPLAGRFFSNAHSADAVSADPKAPWHPPVIINERAMRLLGFTTPASAIGKNITMTRVSAVDSGASEVIGVVPDFSFKTVRELTNPMIYYADPAQHEVVSIKLKGNDIPETLAAIDELSKRMGMPNPPRKIFLDQYLQNLYSDVLKQGIIFAAFAFVAVFIACLGLYGLSAFTAERRTKEIGIRKAMGANTATVTRLLLWQFAKPVLWANLIAWPAGAFFMNRWLKGFAYHIDLEPWPFIAATAAAMAIALFTVSAHCYLIARAKPIYALRYE